MSGFVKERRVRPVRWGIVSTGRIARTFASDLRHVREGEVVAVGSRRRESAATFAAEFSIPRAHGSYEALVADPNVDAVYVATPHPLHLENALLALEHGKPVLVEKAFTMNAGEARVLIDRARATGLFVMEAMWTRFLPHVVELRRLVAEGALGELVLFEADHGKWFERDPASRLFAPELGGSALLDLGIYPVSFASMLFGRPSTVRSLVTPSFTGVDGQVSMVFGYASGAHALLTCTSSARSATRACLTGRDARVEIRSDFYAPTTFELIPRFGESRIFGVDVPGRGLQFQAVEVARCLEEGLLESPVMPLAESLAIMETLDEVLGVGAGA
ncbi:MAG: Gfo/Idh/MocA family oxidoreductase [Acidobacteriota bacterium]|nr:Gfo/Idh/MocA family oxidoreductase [Acidobacteriota bacterium]